MLGNGNEGGGEGTYVMGISRQPSLIQIMIDQKQPENVEYFNYLCSKIINDARGTREMKSRAAMAKAVFSKNSLFDTKLHLNLRREVVKYYIWSRALNGDEN